jgi:hypothetical protein
LDPEPRFGRDSVSRKKTVWGEQGTRPQTCSGFSYPIRIKVVPTLAVKPLF